MNIQDAAKAISEGHKVRRVGWKGDSYIFQSKIGKWSFLYDQDGDRYVINCLHTLLADDWEIYEDSSF